MKITIELNGKEAARHLAALQSILNGAAKTTNKQPVIKQQVVINDGSKRQVIGSRKQKNAVSRDRYIYLASKRNAGAEFGLTAQQFKQRLTEEFNAAIANNTPIYTDMPEALKPYGIKVDIWWKHGLSAKLSIYEQYVLRGLFYNPVMLKLIEGKLNHYK